MSTYTAEYGLKGGAQVNFITKRGGSSTTARPTPTSAFTGLNATPYFNNADNIPKPEYRYSTIGGNLGGPMPRIPRINADGTEAVLLLLGRRHAAEEPAGAPPLHDADGARAAGDFSQTRTPTARLIVVRDPLTGRRFPGNMIPAESADPRGLALLNMLPMPNTDRRRLQLRRSGSQHPGSAPPAPAAARLSPDDQGQLVGQGADVVHQERRHQRRRRARHAWGLVRQRYDFTADQVKIDYTRILGANTVLEAGFGMFYSTEHGPPEDDTALAGIQRASYPALANLPQFAGVHNPLNLIPKVDVRHPPEQRQHRLVPNINYDNRWPITGARHARSIAVINLTHTRGAHTFKAGVLREHERFSQARSGIFGGEFNFSNDARQSATTPASPSPTPISAT